MTVLNFGAAATNGGPSSVEGDYKFERKTPRWPQF